MLLTLYYVHPFGWANCQLQCVHSRLLYIRPPCAAAVTMNHRNSSSMFLSVSRPPLARVRPRGEVIGPPARAWHCPHYRRRRVENEYKYSAYASREAGPLFRRQRQPIVCVSLRGEAAALSFRWCDSLRSTQCHYIPPRQSSHRRTPAIVSPIAAVCIDMGGPPIVFRLPTKNRRTES